MKRIWLGFTLPIIALMLVGSACGRDKGPATHSVNLSVLAQTLYGAGPDKIVRFKQGDIITIHITADEPMELFLHGYDVETRVKPGATGTLQFTANIPGRHALMLHALGDDEGSHKKVEILLGVVDVLPRN